MRWQLFVAGALFHTACARLGWNKQLWEPLVHGTAAGVILLVASALMIASAYFASRND